MDAVSCWAAFPSQALLWGGQEGFLHFKPRGRIPLVAVGLRAQTLSATGCCSWIPALSPFPQGIRHSRWAGL